MKLNKTGRKMSPCAAPNKTIPKYILKYRTVNIRVFANPSTAIPTNFVNVIPEKICK
jgi:hypothetical protein